MKQRNEQLAQLSDAQRALLASRLKKASATALQSAIPRRDNRAVVPLSFGQQRFWLLDQLDPGSVVANVLRALRLTGPLDPGALQRSLTEIVRRHDVLRTTMQAVAGQPVGVLQPITDVPLPLVDLREGIAAEREAEAQRLAREEAGRPFDLARGPLFRAKLLRLGEEQHVLLLLMHHGATDGWSTGVLVQELAALYEAFATGRPSPLQELPIQYADFALWQRNLLEGETLQKHAAYWKEQLGSGLPVLDLPTDRPRPSVTTYRGARRRLTLPPSLCEALQALSRREGVTLFMTLLAGLKVLLARYTLQEDIVVGSPVSGRTHLETEGLIGFFVNTLVLRTHLPDSATFRDVLHRVRTEALSAFAHQELPYEKLVEVLQPTRDPSRTPLYQVTFQLRNFAPPAGAVKDLKIEPCEYEIGIVTTDLDIAVQEQTDGLACWCDYNVDLFDGATIERMLGHFQQLLEGAAAEPAQRIAGLPLLTTGECHQLLHEWSETRAEPACAACVQQLFEAQVEKTPDAVAVVCEDEHLTYRELNRRANQLAHYLRRLGVGPDILVGIYLDRSVEMLLGLLGTFKAGGAYVPLDPSYPTQRLAFMLADAQVRVLLTRQRLGAGLPSHAAQVIELDTSREALASESEENPASWASADDLAYVMYTSGSTGTPKGVMIPQRGLVNYLTWCTQAYDVAAGPGAPVHSSLSFDLTITGLFAPLLVGRWVQLLPEALGIETLCTAWRAGTRYSLIKITPAHLTLLSQQLAPQEAAGGTRCFIIGGENLTADCLAFWQEFAPDTVLINEYGPTETVVGCCVYNVPRGKHRSGSIPIGRPIANTQLYVLDRQLQPVPVGVPGELYIGGAGVARGYLHRPALTAERFLPDPFSGTPGARLYKTGDRVRYLPDGNLEFLGRLDDQVKIRGFRIELAEIEATLEQHPAVRQGIVRVHEEVSGDKRLVAYLTTHDQPAPSVAELRSFLKQQLPDYMVPAAFVFVESFPLTNNGKIDRRALPAPAPVRDPRDEAFTAPRTPLEELLAGIWTQVLGLDQVGIHEDFFTLGGHSLLATQVMSRVRNTFQVELPLRRLFETPTIAGLATIIAQALAETAEQDELARLVAEVEGLSEEQTHLLLQQVD